MRWNLLAFVMLVAILSSVNASRLSGPSSITINEEGSKAFTYEVENTSQETKNLELRVYCPKEILCELENVPQRLESRESTNFSLVINASQKALSKQYMISIVAKLGDEILEKKTKVSVESYFPEEYGNVPTGMPTSPMAFLSEGTILVNILLAIIAIILLWLLIIKLREGEKHEIEW